MRILVTGGAGYVGGFAARHLMKQGHHVVVLDNLCQGHAASLPKDVLVVGDIADRALIAQLLKDHDIDAVMHFAAATNVGESVGNPAYHYRNNTVNTLGLLETMIEHDVRKIVFSSTAATYGELQEMPLQEDAIKIPINPYGCSKLAVEWQIQDFSHAYGLSYAILRYFNASGAAPDGKFGEDHSPETHLIPLIIEAVMGKRDSVTLFGDDWDTRDGTCLRDYVHVDDLALAHELALEAMPAPGTGQGDAKRGGNIFNIGTSTGATVMEVVNAVQAVTGEKVPYVIGPRRDGDPSKLVASSERLRSVLGWKPRYDSIESIVETAWQWHKNNPTGYEK